MVIMLKSSVLQMIFSLNIVPFVSIVVTMDINRRHYFEASDMYLYYHTLDCIYIYKYIVFIYNVCIYVYNTFF